VTNTPYERFGPFLMIRPLGRGGMGEVFIARTPWHDPRVVAVKRLRPDTQGVPTFAERFEHESLLAVRLQHAHVVGTIDTGTVGGQHYVASSLVVGKDAGTIADRLRERGQGAPVAVVIRILVDVLEGLAYVHSAREDDGRWLQLVHRDVTPGNVLIAYDGEARLADFGLAKSALTESAHLTSHGEILGTPHYLAPEIIRGQRASTASDIYGLGAVTYRILTGVAPFQGSTGEVLLKALTERPRPLREWRPDLPPWFAELVHEMLDPDPKRRPFDAGLLVRRVEHEAKGAKLLLGSQSVGRWLQQLFDAERRAELDELDAIAAIEHGQEASVTEGTVVLARWSGVHLEGGPEPVRGTDDLGTELDFSSSAVSGVVAARTDDETRGAHAVVVRTDDETRAEPSASAWGGTGGSPVGATWPDDSDRTAHEGVGRTTLDSPSPRRSGAPARVDVSDQPPSGGITPASGDTQDFDERTREDPRHAIPEATYIRGAPRPGPEAPWALLPSVTDRGALEPPAVRATRGGVGVDAGIVEPVRSLAQPGSLPLAQALDRTFLRPGIDPRDAPPARPDIGRGDVARPDLARPDLARPDALRPDLARPDVARTDLALAELGRIDAGRSEARAGEARAGEARDAAYRIELGRDAARADFEEHARRRAEGLGVRVDELRPVEPPRLEPNLLVRVDLTRPPDVGPADATRPIAAAAVAAVVPSTVAPAASRRPWVGAVAGALLAIALGVGIGLSLRTMGGHGERDALVARLEGARATMLARPGAADPRAVQLFGDAASALVAGEFARARVAIEALEREVSPPTAIPGTSTTAR
jgi:serine/threonine-protein kinase